MLNCDVEYFIMKMNFLMKLYLLSNRKKILQFLEKKFSLDQKKNIVRGKSRQRGKKQATTKGFFLD